MSMCHVLSLASCRSRGSSILASFMMAMVLAAPPAALAAVYDAYPPGGLSQILTLQPGDTLILHAGTYSRVYTGGMTTNGTATGWITIKGADNEPRPLIDYAGVNNIFDLSNKRYFKFQNLEIQKGSDTFKFTGTCHDIILENIYMHDAADGCVNASGIVEMYNLTVRGCEIARIASTSTGEAFYLGGHEKTYQPQVHDSLIEQNYIHDVNEGVELKAGCTNITVRDNVISANRGYPSMTIYGTYKTDNNLRYRIYRNFIFGSSDSGIQCTSDAEITNNIIVNSQYNGLSIRARNLDGKMQNITIANNTFYGAANTCLQVSNGGIATNVVIANNAIYQASDTATAFNAAEGVAGVTLANNLYYGTANASSAGLILGPAPAAAFLNASATLGQMDLYPLAGGALIDAASNTYAPTSDFNILNRPRNGTADVGAYEFYYATNPGWKLAAGFGGVGIPGDATRDGKVNVYDLQRLAASWNKQFGQTGYDPACDFTGDKKVNVFDLQAMAGNWNRF